jgi:hypothetical protein
MGFRRIDSVREIISGRADRASRSLRDKNPLPKEKLVTRDE